MLPSYRFDRADVIVSFDADFLSNWISPIVHSHQFSTTRKLGKDKKDMSRLYVFESILSITGANADYRLAVRPSEQASLLAALHDLIARELDGETVGVAKDDRVAQVAKDLLGKKGKSLVLSGSKDKNVQLLVTHINSMLENYGATIDTQKENFERQGSDLAFDAFLASAEQGEAGVVVFLGANPLYNHPKANALQAALKNVECVVSASDRLDETARVSHYNAPTTHFLENWGDAETSKRFFLPRSAHYI